MTFERVQSRSHSDAPCITFITDTCTAYFNRAAQETFFEGIDRIEFFLDRDAAELGIARNANPTDGYPLRGHDDGGGLSVSVGTVMETLDADDRLDASVRLELERDHEEGLLIADAEPLFEEVNDV